MQPANQWKTALNFEADYVRSPPITSQQRWTPTLLARDTERLVRLRGGLGVQSANQ